MKKIAIFVSGSGQAAERVVKLFNGGNRVHTDIVVADLSATPLLEKLKSEKDVTLISVSDAEWHSKAPQLASLIKEKDVRLIVLDDFALAVPDELMEAVDGEILNVSSPELAPKEVVAALEKDLRKPAEEPQPEQPKEEVETPTMESEWAKSLNIRFTPPKVPKTPPTPPEVKIPGNQSPESQPDSVNVPSEEEIPLKDIESVEPLQPSYPGFNQSYYHPHPHHPHPHREKEEEPSPMPPTWLIWSVLVTVFCCFIPGIIAIIFSSQVSSRYYAGDIQGAWRSSRTAEIWIIISFVLGVLSATLYLPFMLLGS